MHEIGFRLKSNMFKTIKTMLMLCTIQTGIFCSIGMDSLPNHTFSGSDNFTLQSLAPRTDSSLALSTPQQNNLSVHNPKKAKVLLPAVTEELMEVRNMLAGFKVEKCIAYKVITRMFGKVCHEELLSIADVLSANVERLTGIKIQIPRQARRRKAVLYKVLNDHLVVFGYFIWNVVLVYDK